MAILILLYQLALPAPTNATFVQLGPFVSTDVVISQLYGGGGNSGASFRNDYIELFNRGTSPVNIGGLVGSIWLGGE